MGKDKFLYKIPKNVSKDSYLHKDNVVDAAARILKKFKKNNEVVCTAEFQSGKTEVMNRLIYVIKNYNNEIKDLGIDIDKYRIYLIVCTSSVNLKNQHKEKLADIRHHIYHLNDINTFLKKPYDNDSKLPEMVDSSLIIFDECHCDAECGKTIDKFRNILDKFSKDSRTKYYKVGFSATPYEQIANNYPKVVMKPGSDYYGLKQMFESYKKIPRIFQSKNLTDPVECSNLFGEIKVCNFYYIIRLPKKLEDQLIVQGNIEMEFKKRKERFDSFIFDMAYKQNINEIIKTKPSKPTVIYIKGKLRVGEYLDTRYVYLVHDDSNNMYTHTTVQSLIGRCCGYGKKNDDTIIYCDMEKAWQHYQWINSGYDVDYIPENCKYVKKNGKGTKDRCFY